MLLTILASPFFQVVSSILTILIACILFYFKHKKFVSADPPPDLIYLNTLRQSHLVSGVTEVKAGLFIKNFPLFDLTKNNFIMDAVVWFEFDPSLISLPTIAQFSFDRGKIVEKSVPQIKAEGSLLLAKYNIQVQFSTNLDYHLFPFNDHRLYIILINESITPAELVFDVSESAFSWSDKLHTNDWNIVGKAVHSGYAEALLDRADPSKKMSHPKLIFSLDLAQAGLRKALLIFLPIFLILFLGSFALSLHPDQVGNGILGLGGASLTALLAYRFVIEKIMPNVGYSTLTDYFFNTALACNGITFVLILLWVNLYKLAIFHYMGGLWFLSLPIILLTTTYYLLYQWHSQTVNKAKIKNNPINDLKKARYYAALLKLVNLTTLQKYAANTKEFPAINNANWLNPDYADFCKQATDKWYWRLGWRFTYQCRKFPWLTLLFKDILLDLVMQREKLASDDFVIRCNAPSAAKWVIWGDLQGAFHSLLRDLRLLQQQGVIDDNLMIIKANYYFIFNGNVVDRSPYVLETLTVVLRLLQLNPNKVFFVKGNHESNELWRDYQTEKELKIKTNYLYKKGVQLDVYLARLFNTLPLAIYIKPSDSENQQMLRVAYYGSNDLPWDESKLEEFLYSANVDPIACFAIKRFAEQKTLPQHSFVKLDAIVCGRTHAPNYRTMNGLDLLKPEGGAVTWSVLSSPTSTFGKLYDFYYDAFVVLDLAHSLFDATLTLYRQDVRAWSGFSSKQFHLLYGLDLSKSGMISFKNQEQIKLGCTIDFSKTSAILGERLYEGLRLSISRDNMLGKTPLQLITLDDQYTPHQTLKNAQLLLKKYHTDIILSPVGTATTEALLPLVHEKKLLVLFPCAGSGNLRKPDLDHLIHFRTSYENEANALVTYAVEKLGLKRFAIFCQDDSYGLGPLASVRKKLKEYAVNDWLEVTYQRNDPTVDIAAQQIAAFNPTVILFFSTNAPSVALIRKLGIERVVGKTLMGISFLTDIFRDFLHTVGLELILSRVVPNIHAQDLPIVREYRTMMFEQDKDNILSEESLEGYINGRILTTILEILQPPITKEKIIAQLEGIENINFGGLFLNFDPLTRELSKHIWIDTGKAEWIPV
jgi:branched-chain amino acid transport system substrate-binding protein